MVQGEEEAAGGVTMAGLLLPATSPWHQARVSLELLERRIEGEGGVKGGRRLGWERGGHR